MTLARPEFPLPDPSFEPTREYWAAAARGELALPRCAGCGRFVWYPTPACRNCGGERKSWERLSGEAHLFTWVVVRQAFLPQLRDEVPFVTALVTPVEDDSVRLATRIVDAAPEDLAIDMPLRVVFRLLRFAGVDGEIVAPLFRPLPPSGA